jgi:hypothetical protein
LNGGSGAYSGWTGETWWCSARKPISPNVTSATLSLSTAKRIARITRMSSKGGTGYIRACNRRPGLDRVVVEVGEAAQRGEVLRAGGDDRVDLLGRHRRDLGAGSSPRSTEHRLVDERPDAPVALTRPQQRRA